jgi:hypothetical protein
MEQQAATKRAMNIFIAATVLSSVACGLGAIALPEKMKQMAGLVMLPALVVPFIMAYVCHRMTGAQGSPFRGMQWGGSGIATAYFVGLLAGLLTIVASVGLGAMGLDFSMDSYIKMAETSGGQDIPSQGEGIVRGMGWATLFIGPTLGAAFGAFLGCLITLPLYGWLGRRLLVKGRGALIGTFVLITLATGWIQSVMPNPLDTDTPLVVKILLGSVAGVGGALASIWFFLRYRSAFVPALFGATFSGMLSVAVVLGSDVNPLIAPPGGLSAVVATWLVTLALWVFKDPGSGKEMAVAAVGADGEPMTPEQLEAVQAEQARYGQPDASPAPPAAS